MKLWSRGLARSHDKLKPFLSLTKMLIATKLGRAVTYDDDLPPLVTKLFKHAVPWGHGTNHNYYLQYENVYGLKTSEGGYIPGEAPTHKYA